MQAVSASNKQLADAYGVAYRTWLRWIKPLRENKEYCLGEQVGRIWTPKQVRIFFNHFDEPQKAIT